MLRRTFSQFEALKDFYMDRFTFPTLVIGFMLGITFLLFVDGVTSYQTEHCAGAAKDLQSESNRNEKSLSLSEDEEREREISKYIKSNPWACGFSGFPRMLIGHMDHHEGFFVSFFTALLFVVTGLLAIFTWQLVTDARAVADEQIRMTQISLKHASDSIDISRKTLNADRAWITFDNYRTRSVANTFNAFGQNIGESLGFHIIMVNYGRGPAIKCHANVQLACVSFASLPPVFTPPQKTEQVGLVIVGPGQAMSLEIRFIDGDNLEDFKSRKKKVFFYAVVDYTTISGFIDNARTEICLEFICNGMKFNPDGKGMILNIEGQQAGSQNTAT